MTRHCIAFAAIVFALWLVATSVASNADDEPVRLKKKEKKDGKPAVPAEKAPEKKPETKPAPAKEESSAEEPPAAAEDEELVLERIAKNLRAAEENLVEAQLGTATRQVQEDILKDLDALIRGGRPPAPSPEQSGTDEQPKGGEQSKQDGSASKQESQPRPTAGKSAANQQKPQRKRSLGRKSSRTRAGSSAKKPQSGPDVRPMVRGQQQPSPDDSTDPSGTTPRKSAAAKSKQDAPDRSADLFKDVWGHLPPSLRAEMDAYFNNRQFMAKYDELIKRYYRGIAEKGRTGK